MRETPPQPQRVQVEERGNTTSIRINPSTALRAVLSFFLVITLAGGIAAGLARVLVQFPEDYAYRLEPITNILFVTLIGLAFALGILRLQVPGYLRRRATEIVIDRDTETLRIISKGWGFGPPTSESVGFSQVQGIRFGRSGARRLEFYIWLDLDHPDRSLISLPDLGEGDFVVLRGALEGGLGLKAHLDV